MDDLGLTIRGLLKHHQIYAYPNKLPFSLKEQVWIIFQDDYMIIFKGLMQNQNTCIIDKQGYSCVIQCSTAVFT